MPMTASCNPARHRIPATTVTLTGTNDQGAISLTTKTDDTGAYSFTNLRPGTYTLWCDG